MTDEQIKEAFVAGLKAQFAGNAGIKLGSYRIDVIGGDRIVFFGHVMLNLGSEGDPFREYTIALIPSALGS